MLIREQVQVGIITAANSTSISGGSPWGATWLSPAPPQRLGMILAVFPPRDRRFFCVFLPLYSLIQSFSPELPSQSSRISSSSSSLYHFLSVSSVSPPVVLWSTDPTLQVTPDQRRCKSDFSWCGDVQVRSWKPQQLLYCQLPLEPGVISEPELDSYTRFISNERKTSD